MPHFRERIRRLETTSFASFLIRKIDLTFHLLPLPNTLGSLRPEWRRTRAGRFPPAHVCVVCLCVYVCVCVYECVCMCVFAWLTATVADEMLSIKARQRPAGSCTRWLDQKLLHQNFHSNDRICLAGTAFGVEGAFWLVRFFVAVFLKSITSLSSLPWRVSFSAFEAKKLNLGS